MNPVSDDGKRIAVGAATCMLLAMCMSMSCHKPLKKDMHTINKIPGKDTVATQAIASKKHRKKKLYLTFDDGPNKGTRNVLHIVQDEQIPVSFFIVGEHVTGSTWQQQLWDSLLAAPNIALCNHSYSHAGNHYLTYYQNPEGVVADFERTKDSLGLTNQIARMPGRNTWRTDSIRYTDIQKSAAAADSLQKAGFIVMGWDVEWHYDPKTMSVTNTADDLLAEIDSSFTHQRTREKDNLVVLAHDQVFTKSDDSIQLRQFLQKLKLRDAYDISLVTCYPGAGKFADSMVALK